MAPIYTCQFYLSINQHITSLVQVYLQSTYLFSALFLSLDVLHPSTSSANSTPSTNSSHPTQGRYQPFMYLLCAIQGALSLFFSLDVPSFQHTKCQFKPPNTRMIPYTPLRHISFCALQGASPSWGTPFSHTSTAPRGYSLHRVPQLMWQSSNVCGTSLNHMSYI